MTGRTEWGRGGRMIGRCVVRLIVAWGLWSAALAAGAENPAGGDRHFIAHWTFDEPSGVVCRDSSGNARDAVISSQSTGVERSPGVLGNALKLQGQHAIAVALKLGGGLDHITFSAWTKPTELHSYREIFRQECAERLLFSFQDNGVTLSLGLNIGGYVECDARIDPRKVMDGRWHHCAATFDGRFMRVFLDGKRIAQLERPGRIATNAAAPGYIGSIGGHGEHFQGGLDDLRIYADALSEREIVELFNAGAPELARAARQAAQNLAAALEAEDRFADALANCRRRLFEKKIAADAELAEALAEKLNEKFPREMEKFVACAGRDLAVYLSSAGNEFHLRAAGRLVELMREYKPLTPGQWARQSPEDLAKWRDVEAIEKRFDSLAATGEASRFSAQWIDVMFAAAGRVQFRPSRAEPVAPYVTPQTPPTRDLTPAEAEDALRRDWLHQADENPTSQRILQEIEWTRRLAGRLSREHSSLEFGRRLAQLAQLEQRARDVKKSDAELYFAVRRLKRAIAFANPLADVGKILLVDMPYPAGSEWRHETRHRLGYMAVPGGRLLVLDGVGPGGHVTQLMPQAPLHGSFWRPDVSWDGRRVLFCFKPHNEKSFHIYEINADGSGLRQLTDGPYDDLDPIYLPDGRHIMFSTTRAHSYVRCMPPTNAFVLARADADGRNIYLISSNNEPDYLPSVLHDGRIVYTRWEYTDKPLWRDQKLWTVNPDGTQVNTLWGNQSVWPDVMKDARAIPNSGRIMFTGSAHHNWFAGSVGIVDPSVGLNFPAGLTKVTADVPWPECGNGPVDPIESKDYHASGRYPAYYSPYPLGERDFLVSAERDGKFMLYLMDTDGNRELVYEGAGNVFHAMPLRARSTPVVIADRVEWPAPAQRDKPADGVIFSSNVYENAPAELRGKARYLRIWHIDPKTYTYWNKRPYISTGPVVSIVQSEGVKRLLGTVPVEPDGSVSFHAPSGKSLHFQLLDEGGRALQTMRSFANVMPGEYRGCLGCHESHSRAPAHGGGGIALSRSPSEITPPPWEDRTVSYPRYVQPALDRYCGKCHEGDGQAVKTLDLSDRPGALGFSQAYHLLTGHPTWGQPYQKPAQTPPGFGMAGVLMVEGYGKTDPAGYKTPAPLASLSYASPLVALCSSGKHYGVKLDSVSLQKLIAWVDAMCPYVGEEEIRQIPDPVFDGVDWLSIRPRIQTAPTIVRPGPVD